MSGLIIPGSSSDTQLGNSAAAEERASLQRHTDRRLELAGKFDKALDAIKDARLLETRGSVVATRVYIDPRDFQVHPRPNPACEIRMIVLTEKAFERRVGQTITFADLVLFTETDDFSRSVAFGSWDGRHVTEGSPSKCMRMRPIIYLQMMLPDEMHAQPGLDSAYDSMSAVLNQLDGWRARQAVAQS